MSTETMMRDEDTLGDPNDTATGIPAIQAGEGDVAQDVEPTRRGAPSQESVMGDAMLQLSVTGMHCHRCQEKVEEAVGRLAGVKEVEVDFNSGTVSVMYDPDRADASRFAETVRETGYTVTGAMALGGR